MIVAVACFVVAAAALGLVVALNWSGPGLTDRFYGDPE